MKITKDIYIEDLVREKAGSLTYLASKGIKCVACGEPIWGTLEEAAKEKGFNEKEIAAIVRDLESL